MVKNLIWDFICQRCLRRRRNLPRGFILVDSKNEVLSLKVLKPAWSVVMRKETTQQRKARTLLFSSKGSAREISWRTTTHTFIFQKHADENKRCFPNFTDSQLTKVRNEESSRSAGFKTGTDGYSSWTFQVRYKHPTTEDIYTDEEMAYSRFAVNWSRSGQKRLGVFSHLIVKNNM